MRRTVLKSPPRGQPTNLPLSNVGVSYGKEASSLLIKVFWGTLPVAHMQ